jgi:hypothetical protein
MVKLFIEPINFIQKVSKYGTLPHEFDPKSLASKKQQGKGKF